MNPILVLTPPRDQFVFLAVYNWDDIDRAWGLKLYQNLCTVRETLNRSIYDLFLKWHRQYSLFVEYQSIDLFKALFKYYTIRLVWALQCCKCNCIGLKYCFSWYSFILVLNLHFVLCYLVNRMKIFFKSSNCTRLIEPNWPTENWLRDEVSIKTESK